MTVGATAITIFHPPAEPHRFATLVGRLLTCARSAPGYVGGRESVTGTGQLDWAVEVTFDSAERLDEWLDGPARREALRDGEAEGFWRQTTDLVLAGRELPPAGIGLFLHSVAHGKEAEFVTAQTDLTVNTAGFPGYEGTAVFPADASGQWMSVLRFRTGHQLTAWLGSRERQEALPQLRDHLTRNFSELPRSAPFGSTVRVQDGQTRITPAWKSAMVVLLCLYPTVMVFSKSLDPELHHLGLMPWLAVFIANVASVALLTWVLVPAASRPLRRWLDPVDGEAPRISVVGAAAVVLSYTKLLLIFALL
jgi:uncharacterized protein